MKILYGIQTTGNGHKNRSLKVIKELRSRNIDVDILTSGGGNINNSSYNFKGLTLKYNSGGIDYWKTFKESKFVDMLQSLKLPTSQYDLIITDFEPISAWAGLLNKTMVVGISNQVSYLSKKTPRPNKVSKIGELVYKNLVPVDEWYGLHYKKYDKNIYQPIISDEIINMRNINGDDIVVYLSSYSIEDIFRCLSSLKFKFKVFHPDITYKIEVKNVTFYPISHDNFLLNLSMCGGVITNAGFGLTSECLYLGKKLYVIPIKKQYEQECNAVCLKDMGVTVGELSSTLIKTWYTKKYTPNIKINDSTIEIVDELIKTI
jgi:uncharacterized protein (TIGR00661 family)